MIITVCRKVFKNTVIENIKASYCGAINIDSCRISFQTDGKRKKTKRTPREDNGVWTDSNSGMKKENSVYADADPKGRFPANFIVNYSLINAFPKVNKQAECKTDDKSGWQSLYVGGSVKEPVGRTLYLEDNNETACKFFKVVGK
tara:strand:+ start:25 stop:459 length:435 start_codon:yes stop_codon:yes gene_type:complete